MKGISERRHGNVPGGASRSLECLFGQVECGDGRPSNHCSGIGRRSDETRENGQYPTTEEYRRCLQASLQTALESSRLVVRGGTRVLKVEQLGKLSL